MNGYTDDGLPIEEFIQALTAQLDRAQVAMATKARVGLPLTFAVKELTIDLRAHIDMVRSEVRIRPAAPGDRQSSTIHLSLTTITRPMIEENTLRMRADEPSLKDVLGDEVTDEERRRLEWAGIHSVSQLRELERESGEQGIERVAQIPAMRLRAALERASRPHVSRVSSDDGEVIRIRGVNLMEHDEPQVRIGGQPVQLLQASERELLVAPLAHQMAGVLAIETSPGKYTEAEFDLKPSTEPPPYYGGDQ